MFRSLARSASNARAPMRDGVMHSRMLLAGDNESGQLGLGKGAAYTAVIRSVTGPDAKVRAVWCDIARGEVVVM